MSKSWLDVEGLSKAYAGVPAVDDVSFGLRPGSIVGLAGKNGAGKSTVIKMLAGTVSADAGEIRIDGRPVALRRPQDAHEHGLAFMHQELEQVPGMSVAENVLLGTRLPRRGPGLVDWNAVHARAAGVLADLDPAIDPREPVDGLSVARKRLVMIARALYLEARLLVLDEPTTSLTDSEIGDLHRICRELAARGGSIVYVSHRLDEIFQLTDHVLVMRGGRMVLGADTADLDTPKLVSAITGHDRPAGIRRELAGLPGQDGTVDTTTEAPLLRVRGLAGGGRVKDMSFDLAAGEILGIAGLVGAGRTELLRMVFGADRADAGTIAVDGDAVDVRRPTDAMAVGIGLLPEDRRHEGLVMGFNLRQNATLAALGRLTTRLGLTRPRLEREVTQRQIERLGIQTWGSEQPVRTLSGGNQQKVVMAKWLERDTRILLCDEPTAGVDVDGKEQLYDLMVELARAGRGVIFVSSEFVELTAVCTRVLVMREGRLVAELHGEQINEAEMVERCYATVEEAA